MGGRTQFPARCAAASPTRPRSRRSRRAWDAEAGPGAVLPLPHFPAKNVGSRRGSPKGQSHPTLLPWGREPAFPRRESKPGIWFEGDLPACILFLEPNSEKAFPLLSSPVLQMVTSSSLAPRPEMPSTCPGHLLQECPGAMVGVWFPPPTHVFPGERWAPSPVLLEPRPQAATCPCPPCTQASSFQELRDIRLLSRFFHVFTGRGQ